jgi:hypothetical protein
VAGQPLTGTAIQVDSVVGLDTNSNDNVVRTCCNCTLSFTTGDITSSTGTAWLFDMGGVVTLVGGVDLNDNGNCNDAGDIPEGTTLLHGMFTGAPSATKFGTTVKIAAASFQDTKDVDLLNFYGLPTGATYYGSFNIGFQTPQMPGSTSRTFTSTAVLSGSLSNCTTP